MPRRYLYCVSHYYPTRAKPTGTVTFYRLDRTSAYNPTTSSLYRLMAVINSDPPKGRVYPCVFGWKFERTQ